MMRLSKCGCLCAWLLTVAAGGAGAVDLSVPGAPIRLGRGEAVDIEVRAIIRDGLHLQAAQPLEDFLIPTRLTFDLPEGVRLVGVSYPAAKPFRVEGFDAPLTVLSGVVTMTARIEAAQDVPLGAVKAAVRLSYQACDEKNCFPPGEAVAEFDLELAAPTGAAPLPDIFDGPATDADRAPAREGEGGWIQRGWRLLDTPSGRWTPLFLAGLGFVFLGGLALNLTPCVYPVVAVTISYFGAQAQAEHSPGARWRLAAAYSLGIVATFTLLFVIASLTGLAFGAWLQNPWVLAGIALVILALALACFGLYDIQPPAWILSRVGASRSGVIGALLMGLTMGVTAAPCVGPIIGVLLVGIGQSGDPWLGVAVGLSLSSGLALPYFILGGFPGLARRMPRAGDWMEWIKRLFGFVLLGVGLYFLAPLLPRSWFLPMFAVLAVVAGVWLGLISRVGRSASWLWFARGMVFTLCIFAAARLAADMRAPGLVFAGYTQEGVEEAARAGEPVMIDFTADWCTPCRVMELRAFPDPRVREAARGVRLLKVDLTHRSEAGAAAAQRYGVAGPPTLVFLDASGRERADLRSGEGLSAEELAERLRRVRSGA